MADAHRLFLLLLPQIDSKVELMLKTKSSECLILPILVNYHNIGVLKKVNIGFVFYIILKIFHK